MKRLVKEEINTSSQKKSYYYNYLLTPKQMHSQNQIKMRPYKTKNRGKLLLTTL
jgi:hypothetical protein